MHMASETLSVSAIVFCICLPINRKNKRQINFLPLVKYLYFIFRITPTIDKEPKLLLVNKKDSLKYKTSDYPLAEDKGFEPSRRVSDLLP